LFAGKFPCIITADVFHDYAEGALPVYDVLIIGAGVIGCAVAEHLSGYTGKIAVIDRADDVSQGASKANSGIVHAGFDAEPGTEKARLNVKGAAMFPLLCERLGIAYGVPGALVLGFTPEDRQELERLLANSAANGVPGCRILDAGEVTALEPGINPAVTCALFAPASGIVSPYELTCALADTARVNGAEFLLDTAVSDLSCSEGSWLARTSRGDLRARAVVNCAGVGAESLHNRISSRHITITPRRGEYYLLDRTYGQTFAMTIFQVPNAMGKGVLVSPTTHGNLLLGPTAEDITDGLDTATTRAGLDAVLEKVRLTWDKAVLRDAITSFSGIRAHEAGGDFIIGAVEGAPDGAFEAVGIDSPGLSAAPAIGEELGLWIAYSLGLQKRGDVRTVSPLPKPFRDMTTEERRIAYLNNPAYGRIVCRCEQVTEAEILYAIRRPVGARSIDGVKRRARAGMGRCQGGFCSARVLEILSRELRLPPQDITKCGGDSRILACTLQEMAREARGND
jgi:glycerol-3-phosphate dehydrogenase